MHDGFVGFSFQLRTAYALLASAPFSLAGRTVSGNISDMWTYYYSCNMTARR